MKRLIYVLVLGGALGAAPAWADPDLPGPGFKGDRYSVLWTKSPFAIATPEAAAASQDYQLVGVAKFDGVSYASLISKQSQEHFVLTSAAPVNNLTLVSISHDGKTGSAIIERGGEQLVLQEDAAPTGGAPAVANGMPSPPPMPMLPGNPAAGSVAPPNYPMLRSIRFHRPPIVVPPPPSN